LIHQAFLGPANSTGQLGHIGKAMSPAAINPIC
jgi:hypothetical protein